MFLFALRRTTILVPKRVGIDAVGNAVDTILFRGKPMPSSMLSGLGQRRLALRA